jgi:hypothetical protein
VETAQKQEHMKSKQPFYKLIISYFEVVENDKNERNVEIIFDNENPLLSRKEAIERYNSYLDIFKEGNNQVNIKNWFEILKGNVENYTIPTMNIYFCENKNSENDLVLFGSLLETFEERMEELVDELNFYKSTNFSNIETDKIKDIYGNDYLVLKNSLFHNDDIKLLKNG